MPATNNSDSKEAATHAYFIGIALAVAEKSKCLRAKYGTVIVSEDGRVISTGYNGKPRGSTNDDVCYREGVPNNAAKPNCCIHSEMNALLFSDTISRKGGTIYVTGRPCTDCALAIAQSGVARLVFLDEPNGSGGHVGNFSSKFHEKYGMKFEVVAVYF